MGTARFYTSLWKRCATRGAPARMRVSLRRSTRNGLYPNLARSRDGLAQVCLPTD